MAMLYAQHEDDYNVQRQPQPPQLCEHIPSRLHGVGASQQALHDRTRTEHGDLAAVNTKSSSTLR